ncbi:hypothetical protein QBC37DRAFT_156703 [Rhypophila decipiens]|uniref:Wax synthase domain-containing protein n=1 Tax=Rhypophila decipiens TaxID=261697 RepID=A0AAN6YDV7_9PEZI|nr:hypothetical protein QBC37DRAFT_156703 [Rhypophila decipiens]
MQQVQLIQQLSPHLLAPISFLLLFALPPFPFRKTIYLVSFLSSFYFGFFFRPDHVSEEYNSSPGLRLALALPWMVYLDWLTKMCLHAQPEHDFWRATPTESPGTSSDGNEENSGVRTGSGRRREQQYYLIPQPHGFIEKLVWAFSLLSSPRGVGWNYEAPAHHVDSIHPKRPLPPCQQGRCMFSAVQVLRCLCLHVLSEILSILLVSWSGSGGNLLSKVPAALDWKKLSLVPLVGVKIWASVEALYAGLNAVLVGMGLAKEDDCKPLFGNNLTSLDSLQEFWGTFIPQAFRRMFQDLGRATCRFLRIRRHSELNWLVHVWVSFFVSGLMVGLAIGYALAPASHIISQEHFRAIFHFFLLQALGLTVETLFLDTPVKDITLYEVGLQDELVMGRLWTWGWLLVTGYWAFETLFPAFVGVAQTKPVLLGFLQSMWTGTSTDKVGWVTKLGWYLSGDGGLLE